VPAVLQVGVPVTVELPIVAFTVTVTPFSVQEPENVTEELVLAETVLPSAAGVVMVITGAVRSTA
jgi:hypothetical protein